MSRDQLKLAWVWYGLGAVMLLGVAVLSLVPVTGVGVSDKLSHGVTYFILAGWFSLLANQRAGLYWIVAGLIVFGLAIEGLQATTGYRYAEWGDVIANTFGVLLGLVAYFTPFPRLLRHCDSKLILLLQR